MDERDLIRDIWQRDIPDRQVRAYRRFGIPVNRRKTDCVRYSGYHCRYLIKNWTETVSVPGTGETARTRLEPRACV